MIMTNAEKYLKDEAGGVQDFTEALMKFNEERKFVTEWYAKAHSKDCIDLFLNEQAKPTLTEDEIIELKRLCKKVVLSFEDEPQMIDFLSLNDKFFYHESTNTFDLEITIVKREKTVDEMLKREPPKKYGTMELFE